MNNKEGFFSKSIKANCVGAIRLREFIKTINRVCHFSYEEYRNMVDAIPDYEYWGDMSDIYDGYYARDSYYDDDERNRLETDEESARDRKISKRIKKFKKLRDE